jgi:DNA (cytosine-5)-methyltransferase 1
VARILDHHRPRALMLENVKNLRSHDRVNTLQVILDTLDGLGYAVRHGVIDASHWMPQRRDWLFIVGFHRDLDVSFACILKDCVHPTASLSAKGFWRVDKMEDPAEHSTRLTLAHAGRTQRIHEDLWTVV